MSQTRTFKVAVLSSGRFLVTLTLLICAAILSRLFTKADYAAYMQTLLAFKFVAPLLMLGLPQALYYFLPRDKQKGRSILTGNLMLLTGMGCLFAIAMWCGGNELLAKRFSNPALNRLLLIYSPYAILTLPVASITACLMAYDKVKILTVFTVASKLIVFVCVIGFALIWRTPDAAVYGSIIAALIAFFPAVFLMYRATNAGDWLPSRANMSEQIKYSVPLGLATMIGTITLSLDKIIVSSMCSAEDFAVYTNGAIEIPVIAIITGSVMAVLLPEFTKRYQDQEYEKIKQIWYEAILKCSLLIFPLTIFLFLAAPQVIRVLFSAKYTQAVLPFRVYLFILPTRVAMYGTLFMCSGNNKLIVVRSSVTLLLDLVLSIIMVKFFGYIGAAISTVIVFYLWVLPFNLYYVRRFLRTTMSGTMPFAGMAKVLLACLLCANIFFIRLWTDAMPDVLNLLVLTAAYFVSYWVILGFSNELKKQVNSVLQTFIRSQQ